MMTRQLTLILHYLILFNIMFRLMQITKEFATKKLIFPSVEFENFGGFGKLTLNRPKALNSLNGEMLADIGKIIPQIENTKAFWMEGAGGKAFCAGGDVKSIYLDREMGPIFFREEFKVDYWMSQLKSIQISNWDGIVMGGGVGISIHSPFRIATERTIFAMPENKLGFFTDVASGYVLSRLRNRIGQYLGTGVQLKGEDVFNAGLANFFVSSANIPKIYEQIKSAVPSSSEPKQTIAQIISKYSEKKQQSAIKEQEKIKQVFSAKTVKQLISKLKSKPQDPFYQQTLKNIQSHSPLSVHVTFQNIDRARNQSLKETLICDFNTASHFLEGKEFFEGIRCVLIDKGAQPSWQYKNIEDVPEDVVKKYFEKLPELKQLELN